MKFRQLFPTRFSIVTISLLIAFSHWVFANQVLKLDGDNDYVSLSYPLPDMTELTIELWAYYASTDGNVKTIFMDADSSGGHDLVLDMNASGIGIRADKSGSSLGYEGAGAIGGLNLGNGWHHIAWSMTQYQSIIYVDGISVFSVDTSASNVGYHSQSPSIGRWWDESNSSRYFEGFLDEIRLWNSARTQDQIQTYMNTELTGGENGLVGYWNFNGSPMDVSLNTNHGHLFGDAQLVSSSDLPISPAIQELSDIPDPQLKSILQSVVGEQRLTDITELDLSNSNISSLFGIHLLPNISKLNLDGNGLRHIGMIGMLPNLTEFSADDNHISNVTSISALSQLTSLSFKNNQIREIKAISGNTNINGTINLKGNPLSNVSLTSHIPDLVERGLTVVYDSPQGEMVPFVDPRLEKIIRAVLPVNQSNPIMKSDLAELTELDLANAFVNNLTGLGECTNLKRLHAGNNQIVDISVISNLGQLTYLDLNHNQIEDISPLTNLSNLNELHLANNNVIQLPNLSSLVELRRLNLENNRTSNDDQLVDISNLSSLTNLTWLKLHNNRISNITSLEGLGKLTYLDLSYNNQIEDIISLVNLSELQELLLHYNRITDLPDLSNLSRLRYLYLRNNRKSDANQLMNIDNLSNLTNLYYLDLRDNYIGDITALTNLTELEHLYIDSNQITNISALKNLTKLRHLSAEDNQITVINELMNWNNMHDGLDLDNNQINDISGLRQLSNLGWISLYNNQLTDITALKNSSQTIRDIRLAGNSISDISAFAEMDLNRITALDLDNNLISDLSPLAGNPTFGQNGGWVQLRGNPLSNVSVAIDLPTLTSTSMSVSYDGIPSGYLALTDPKIETAIREQLDKPLPQQPSSLSHLLAIDENLTTLDLAYLRVADLSGLETLENLNSVDISGHQIKPSLLTQQVALIEAQGIQVIVRAEWLASITATSQDSGVNPQTVDFGASKEASSGIDDGLDIPAPMPPPDNQGVDSSGLVRLNVYFDIGETTHLRRDFRADTLGPMTYQLDLRSDQDSVELTWDMRAVPPRYNSVKLKQTSPANGLVIDLLEESSAIIGATASQTTTFELALREAIDVTLIPGWNLISIPGQPLDNNPQSLISPESGIVPPFYRWEATTFTYQQVEELRVGEGYWILTTNDSESKLEIPYRSVDSYTQSLSTGWNMIGSLNQSADFSQPIDTPDNSIFPQSLFSWEATGFSYQLSNQIEPGKGYWVLTLADCQLTVDAGTTASAPMVVQTPDIVIPLLIKSDNFNQTLYLGLDPKSNQGLDNFDQLIPPISPSSTGTSVKFVRSDFNLAQDVQPLEKNNNWRLEWSFLQTAYFQVDLSQLPESHQLIVDRGEEVLVLQTDEPVEIGVGKGSIQLRTQTRISRPKANRLLQNYPNPFNPETWIPFELKEDTGVELSIYDSKGQFVRQIELGHRQAGRYVEPSAAIYWDGKTQLGETVASGVYFYTLTTRNYTQTCKMIILK